MEFLAQRKWHYFASYFSIILNLNLNILARLLKSNSIKYCSDYAHQHHRPPHPCPPTIKFGPSQPLNDSSILGPMYVCMYVFRSLKPKLFYLCVFMNYEMKCTERLNPLVNNLAIRHSSSEKNNIKLHLYAQGFKD